MMPHVQYRSRWQQNRSSKKKEPTPPKTETAYWHKLVEDNTKLAFWCVNRFAGKSRSLNLESLESEALAALVKAARLYDPAFRTKRGRPVKFGTYAVRTVKNALIKLMQKETLYRQLFRQQAFGRLLDREGFESDGVPELRPSRALPLRLRQVALLKYGEGLTQVEIAARLGITQQRVSQVVSDIRKRIGRQEVRRHHTLQQLLRSSRN